jgi:hypothetical protein
MLGLPYFLADWLTDGSEVARPYVPATIYSPRRFLVLIFVRCRVNPRAIVQLEELGQLKNTVASSEIEHTTLQLVA